MILLENDDTRGKPIEVITRNKAFGSRRPCEYEVCESWFLVERCTANRFVRIECGRCQTFITKDTGQCGRRFVNQEEVSAVRRSGKAPYSEGIQLNPEE